MVGQENTYQEAYLAFQHSIPKGLVIIEKLQAIEGLNSVKATHFVKLLENSQDFVTYINHKHKILGLIGEWRP